MDRSLKPIEQGSLIANLMGSMAFRALFMLSLATAIILGPLTYWAFDNEHPYDFYLDGSEIKPSPAKGNDQMLVEWNVTFHRACHGVTRREIIDPDTEVILAQYDVAPTATQSAVSNGKLTKTFTLPKNIQKGWLGYRVRLEFNCNPLQYLWPIRYSTPTLLFEVKGEEK